MKKAICVIAAILIIAAGLAVFAQSVNEKGRLYGDVDLSGKIEASDYLMLKRHILGSYTITGEGLELADVDRSGNVEPVDYLMIKRQVLGTYEISQPDDPSETVEFSEAVESLEVSEPDESSLPDESSGPEQTEKDWPCLSGTFLQPWGFTDYTAADFETHFDYLLEVGIDTVILQWVAETPYGKLLSVYYPTELSITHDTGYYAYPDLLPNMLQAAENKGVKIFVGLNLADEWWDFACTNAIWNRNQSNLGVQMAEEIYTKYKELYPNALYGWYFAWEMFNGMYGYELSAASFLNQYIDPLDDLDPDMPFMLSPFVRSAGGDAFAAGEEWKLVFAATDFRDGDIFCCQDAVGAEHITIDEMDGYFSALKGAVDTKPGLLFWANDECFTKDYHSRPVSELIKQMRIAQPYVTGFVTFAYSHYYSPDYVGTSYYHNQYKRYYQTGSPD